MKFLLIILSIVSSFFVEGNHSHFVNSSSIDDIENTDNINASAVPQSESSTIQVKNPMDNSEVARHDNTINHFYIEIIL